MPRLVACARVPFIAGGLALGLILLAAVSLRDDPAIAEERVSGVVYKDPNCGCCSLWVEHLERAGFELETRVDVPMAALKRELGVPQSLWSCHTAVIDGYVIEGHVPAEDVYRLLTERPSGLGIAVPGMPIGSPGMEVGNRKDPYDVVLFTETGETSVFASH